MPGQATTGHAPKGRAPKGRALGGKSLRGRAPSGEPPILVTGAAGFIGYHMAQRLLDDGYAVLGLDNLNDYYSVALKEARLGRLQSRLGFQFARCDLADTPEIAALFDRFRFQTVVHLGAQAGVRYSLENPHAYTRSNIEGFLNILEGSARVGVRHLLYASSSSVYGDSAEPPFSVHRSVDHPVSLYAATKKANELMAHTYSHLYRLPTTGLRFFTVYGPWGRPDMALFSFTAAILAGQPIQVFNQGDMVRDFTYIDDIIEAVMRLCDQVPTPNPDWRREAPDPGSSTAPYRLYNLGNNAPVRIGAMIETLEASLGRKAIKEFLPMQPGDVALTYADVTDLEHAIGFRPDTPIKAGIERFVAWYRDFYRV